ncbi:MAG: hypothetical protein N2595_02120 [bacterium]|nr:hypothetical protein [bacterium]
MGKMCREVLWGIILGMLSGMAIAEEVVRIPALTGRAGNVIPFAIPDFAGDGSGQLAQIVRRDLSRYGTFVEAPISPPDMRTLDAADRSKGLIHFKNWANLGAQVLGKGTLQSAGEVSVEFALYKPHTGQRLFGKRYSASAGGMRRIAHMIADDIVEAVLKEKGFFASRLLYVHASGPSRNIFICDSDGANNRQLTRSSSLCVFPRWFPQGDAIVFTAYFEGRPVVYRMDLRSGSMTKLVNFPGMNTSAAVSPDGRKVAVILDKDGMPELYTIDLFGGPRVRLTRGRAAESTPSWSPDGRQIVFSSEEGGGRPQIFIINANGGTPQRISNPGFSRYCTSPVWSPDGKKIAYVAQIGGNFDLCLYDIPARQTYRLTNDPSNDEEPSWARNSRHLAFTRGSLGGGGRIMLLDTETGKVTPLLGSAACSHPTWQP